MSKLHVIETDRDLCIRSVIETLETALYQAREGNITAIAVAVVRPNLAINVATSQCDNIPVLLGAISLLQRDVLDRIQADR